MVLVDTALKDKISKIRVASRSIGAMCTAEKDILLLNIRDSILQNTNMIIEANQVDMHNAAAKLLPDPLIDRLRVTGDTVNDMCCLLLVVNVMERVR